VHCWVAVFAVRFTADDRARGSAAEHEDERPAGVAVRTRGVGRPAGRTWPTPSCRPHAAG
jgi:hypothetical protein